MGRNYKQSEDIPNGVLAKRLEELSDAVVARMHGKKHVFDNEFTCRIPAELDRVKRKELDMLLRSAPVSWRCVARNCKPIVKI